MALLSAAASTRNWDEVDRLLKTGKADVNKADRSGMTCLMWTAQWDNVKIARELINQGANVNAASSHGVTPVIFAADGNARDIVRLLIQHQADLEVKSRHGMSALLTAARSGAAPTLKVLLEGQADVNVKDCGMTALMYAAEEGHADAVQVLLEHGAAVNFQDRDGQSALIYAAKKNATLRPRHNFAPMVDYIAYTSHLPSVLELLLMGKADVAPWKPERADSRGQPASSSMQELRDRDGKKALDYAGAKSYHLLESWVNREALE
ncbi:unnamed protein product [Effrenium voratum]|uniref:Ankyrin repeat protein n=1 Tax=Effrenium voratum TaxID=2562239 RepID=A0AA36J1X4_9DINO|nr:unnamed protein product [Effrenium voratum]CAJ1427625.1 unnamed protein product [Effrenium voratum]